MTRNLQSLIFILCLLVILGLPAHTTAAEPASRWYRFTSANGLAGNIVQAIWEDPQGRIWFGTEDGASRYDGQQWATFRPADGLLDANVWAISGDAEAVWFATSSGLSRYDGAAWQRFSAADGLPGDDVRAVHVAADGTTWAGTFGQGIAFLRPGAQRWRILPLPATFQRSGVFVQSIWQAGDGTLWFGTNGLGALRLRNNRLEQFSFRAGARNTVWAIGATNGMENGSADTWLATFKGLVRVASDDRIAIAEQIVGGVSLSNTEALAVAGDASGTLWFATRAQGVLRYDSHGWQRIEAADGLGRNYVQSILADRAGRVWFGTRGGGVSVLQRSPLASETLQSEVLLYTAEGEPLQDISSGLLAVQNDLRFVFSTKPSWLPPNELRFRYQLQRLGHGPLAPPVLVEAGPTMPILARSEVLIDLPPGQYRLDVEALVGGTSGPPTSLAFTIRSAPPSLPVGGVAVASDEQIIAAGTTLPQLLFGGERSVELRLNARDDTTRAAQITYEYRLLDEPLLADDRRPTTVDEPVGMLGDWHHTTGNTALLSLPPGTYQAEVRAVDGDGNRSEAVLLTIVVPPPLWTTILLASLVILLPSVASGLGGALLYRRLMRRQALRRAINGYRIPYDVGPLITLPDRYIGRNHVLDTVLGKIANHSFYIYGEKRIGKTSLLLQIGQRLRQRARMHPQQPIIVVFRNIQQVPAEQFWLYLVRSIVAELPIAVEGLLCHDEGRRTKDESLQDEEGGQDWLSSLVVRPSSSYDDLDAEIDLEQIVQALRRGEAGSEPLVVLMIDEIDTVQAYDPALRQRLRAFCQHAQRHLRIILAGVVPPAAEPGDTSPWYNIFERVALGPLSQPDTLHLIRNYNDNPYRYSAAAEQAILAAGERKPYATQWLCSEAVRAMLAARRTTVSTDDVAAAVAVLLAARDGEYRALWRKLSPQGQAALRNNQPPANPAERELLAAEGGLVRETGEMSVLFRKWVGGERLGD